MKAKNKLHVLNTVMRVEQKRNSELQLQLKQSHMSIDKARTSCECLTSSVQSLTAEKEKLHLELDKSRKEVRAINSKTYFLYIPNHTFMNSSTSWKRFQGKPRKNFLEPYQSSATFRVSCPRSSDPGINCSSKKRISSKRWSWQIARKPSTRRPRRITNASWLKRRPEFEL